MERNLANFKAPTYEPHFDYIDTYLSQHRDHQLEACFTALSHLYGQIISPCGTGKTRIEVYMLVEKMFQLLQQNRTSNFLIASHRLSLNRQLLQQLLDVVIRCGFPFDVAYVGSYRCDLSKYYTDYFNLGYSPKVSRHLITLDSKELTKFANESKALGRHCIISSTYHSLPVLKGIGEIEQAIFDEAHNTIQDDFTANLLAIISQLKSYHFFTATRKVAGKDGGMNNEAIYGQVLFDACPKEMLAKGEIVCPKIHLVDNPKGETTNETNTAMLVKNLIEAFEKHREWVKNSSCSPDDIGAKLLTGCEGIDEMHRMYKPIKERLPTVPIYAIDSTNGAFIDGKKVSKEAFFNSLMALPDSQDAIILNVDMLTEGIDLPSITGVMPLRNLGLIKLIQMFGRALRLHLMDRKRLYAGELLPTDYTNYVKPYGYLVIPAHLSSLSKYKEMIEIARKVYEEYGTKAEEMIIQEKFVDHDPDTLNSMIPNVVASNKDYDLKHAIMSLAEQVNLSLFRENVAKLPHCRSRLQYIKDMFRK